MKAKTKTVGDLLKLLKGLDPDTELWTQDTRDYNECLPIVNLPEITEIVEIALNYETGGSRKIWVGKDSPYIEDIDEDEDTVDGKMVVVWNV